MNDDKQKRNERKELTIITSETLTIAIKVPTSSPQSEADTSTLLDIIVPPSDEVTETSLQDTFPNIFGATSSNTQPPPDVRKTFKLVDLLQLPFGESATAETPNPTEEIISTDSPTKSPTVAPSQSTVDVVTNSPTQSLVDVVTDSPAQSTVDVATDSPAQSTVDVVTDSPTQSSVDVVTDSPTQSPVAEITNSPTQSPVDDVTSSPTETPVEEKSAPTIAPTEAATTATSTVATTTITPVTGAKGSSTEPPVDGPGTESPVSIGTLVPTSNGTPDSTLSVTATTTSGVTASYTAGFTGDGVSSTQSGSETETPDYNFTYAEPQVELNVLIIAEEGIYKSVKKMAKEYLIYTDGEVKVNVEVSVDDYPKVRGDASQDVSGSDAYIINPTKAGISSVMGYFTKLEEYVNQEEFDFAWNDVFPAYRENVNKFANNLYMIPVQGDVLSMYYRRDVLEEFGLSVPKTWQEYNDVAAAVHGKPYGDTTLIGSCIPRRKGCGSYIWTNLILASMTQNKGTKSGFLFDPFTMKPLTGEAMGAAIGFLEGQVLHGAPDEFNECDTYLTETTKNWMKEGRCVLTYSWGSVFKAQSEEGSTVDDLISAAPTPGSLYVLDRTTHDLERCNEELCGKYGYYDTELGWINRAPYAAHGGFAGVIPKNINPEKAIDTASFLAFASNNLLKAENATKLIHDPYRKSQLNVDAYEGISPDEVQTYFDTVESALMSDNMVMDIRFSEASDINQSYENKVSEHLEKVLALGTYSSISDRMRVSNIVTASLKDIIKFHDSYSDIKAVTKYQESLNLMVGISGMPSDFRSGSGAVRTDAWISITVCAICMFYMTLR